MDPYLAQHAGPFAIAKFGFESGYSCRWRTEALLPKKSCSVKMIVLKGFVDPPVLDFALRNPFLLGC